MTTEKQLFILLKKKLTILRVSNVIGLKRNLKNKRKIHKLFLDNYINFMKRKKIFIFNNNFKDFITIEQFCSTIYKIFKTQIYGIYNLSLGKKIYLKEIVAWLNVSKIRRIIVNETIDKNNSFTLSNKKLSSKINIDFKKNDVKKFCVKISNNNFR